MFVFQASRILHIAHEMAIFCLVFFNVEQNFLECKRPPLGALRLTRHCAT